MKRGTKIVFGLIILMLVFLIIYFINVGTFFCNAVTISCGDGTIAGCDGRCPEIKYCDANEICDEGYGCYEFENFEGAYCFKDSESDPCSRCGGFNNCSILKTNPMQVVCE